jgi:hypothetical protein
MAIVTGAGCCGLWLLHWSFYAEHVSSKFAAGWSLFALGSLYIAIGALIAIAIETHEAAYGSEGVEIRCAIPLPKWTGWMLRSDIAAKWNASIFALQPTYVLFPKEPNKKQLTIWVPRRDDYFRNWIAGIPDADRQFVRNRRRPNRKP